MTDPSTRSRWKVGQEWAYRLSQGLYRLSAPLFPPDDRLASNVLKDDELTLFRSMPLADRQHSLCVAQRLKDAGATDSDLLTAALLHDVGKVGGGLNLVRRTAIVLMGPTAATRLAPQSTPTGVGWARALWVHRHHAELGAQRCAQIGASPIVVELVRLHDSAGAAPGREVAWRLDLLREADNRC